MLLQGDKHGGLCTPHLGQGLCKLGRVLQQLWAGPRHFVTQKGRICKQRVLRPCLWFMGIKKEEC